MSEQAPETTRQQALNAASSAAFRRLKDNHLDEYNTYYAEEAAKRGQKWEPKLNKHQKAEREFRRLLAENPELAMLIPPDIAAQVTEDATT